MTGGVMSGGPVGTSWYEVQELVVGWGHVESGLYLIRELGRKTPAILRSAAFSGATHRSRHRRRTRGRRGRRSRRPRVQADPEGERTVVVGLGKQGRTTL